MHTREPLLPYGLSSVELVAVGVLDCGRPQLDSGMTAAWGTHVMALVIKGRGLR